VIPGASGRCACPVSGKEKNFLGPAALAKLYRFHAVPVRPIISQLRLATANPAGGAVSFMPTAKLFCPKGVPPVEGIGKARRQIKKSGIEPEQKF
jgi:succinate dehydrogenase / fumarate reductase iron-sulfur subunit